MLNFVESLAPTARIFTVSCRTDMISFYTRRGYKEVKRVPVEEYIPAHYMTRSGLKMVIMTRCKGKTNLWKNKKLEQSDV